MLALTENLNNMILCVRDLRGLKPTVGEGQKQRAEGVYDRTWEVLLRERERKMG